MSSHNDLAVQLQSLSKEDTRVSLDRFRAFLDDIPKEVTPTEFHQVVNFASEQAGIWEADYSFSLANSPDSTAKTESEQWEELCGVLREMLLELAPHLKDVMQREHRLIVAKHCVAKSLEYTKDKPLQKLMASILSRIAIAISAVGLGGISSRLYAIAMYPKGSVGRNNM